MSHPISLLIADHILGKKVPLIVFKTQILPNILPVMRTLSFIIMTYLKKLTGIKSLNTKHCPAGFYLYLYTLPLYLPRCIHPLTKSQQNWVVLINHSWIFSTIQRGWRGKNREVSFHTKKVEAIYKRVIYHCCLSLCL